MSEYNFNQISFQDSATPIAEGIVDLHDYIMFYVLIIFGFVLWVYMDILIQNFEISFNFWARVSGFIGNTNAYELNQVLNLRRFYFFNKRYNHETNLEIIWTLIPSFILITIAIPSLSLLYSMDELLYPRLTLKVTGLQWYWTYEYSDAFINQMYLNRLCKSMFGRNFLRNALEKGDTNSSLGAVTDYFNFKYSTVFSESYMIPDSDISNYSDHRLLSTDSAVVLPWETHIRVLVTGADVLHSWAVPSFGIKIDAVPGRLNQVGIYLKRQGTFYGQCSELCGVNHGFMPIVVKSVEFKEFHEFLTMKLQEALVANKSSLLMCEDLERIFFSGKAKEKVKEKKPLWKYIHAQDLAVAFMACFTYYAFFIHYQPKK